jgi:hypothetical protein
MTIVVAIAAVPTVQATATGAPLASTLNCNVPLPRPAQFGVRRDLDSPVAPSLRYAGKTRGRRRLLMSRLQTIRGAAFPLPTARGGPA